MADAGIVRSNAKIDAAIESAKIYLAMHDAGEDFSDFCWGFVGGQPVQTGAVGIGASSSRSMTRRSRGSWSCSSCLLDRKSVV